MKISQECILHHRKTWNESCSAKRSFAFHKHLHPPKNDRKIAPFFTFIQIFDNFRESNPQIFDKVVAMEGDVGEDHIGISEKDRTTILNEVSIIFHNAALLKMDATLRQAINVNTKGVIRMLDIAAEMKNLEVSFQSNS